MHWSTRVLFVGDSEQAVDFYRDTAKLKDEDESIFG
jgi:hypothetical protein